MYQRYQPILGVRPLRRLLVASVIGRLPLGTCSLAVLLLVRTCTHSYAVAGISVGALALAQAAVAPLNGRWLDRFGTIRVVAPAAAIQVGALGLLALVAAHDTPHGAFVALSALIGVTMPPVSSATRALWSDLLSEPGPRNAAFSLDAIGQEFVWTTGPVMVGVVSATVSPRLAVLMVALITLIASAWFITAVSALALGPARSDAEAGTSPGTEISWLLAPITFLLGMSLGGTEVGLPALASHISHATLSGILLALWSVGSMLGGVAFGARHWSVPRERLLALLLLGGGLLVVPVMLSHSPVPALVSSFAAGVCLAPVFSCTSSLIAEHASAQGMARAFTRNTAALVSGAAAGSALSGEVVSHLGVTAAFAVAGSVGVLAGIVAFGLPTAAAAVPSPVHTMVTT